MMGRCSEPHKCSVPHQPFSVFSYFTHQYISVITVSMYFDESLLSRCILMLTSSPRSEEPFSWLLCCFYQSVPLSLWFPLWSLCVSASCLSFSVSACLCLCFCLYLDPLFFLLCLIVAFLFVSVSLCIFLFASQLSLPLSLSVFSASFPAGFLSLLSPVFFCAPSWLHLLYPGLSTTGLSAASPGHAGFVFQPTGIAYTYVCLFAIKLSGTLPAVP